MQQTRPDARTLLGDLYSLTVLRPMLGSEGLNALEDCLKAACADDMAAARAHYCRMYAKMLGAARLTGEVFRDYWLFMTISRGFARYDSVGLTALGRDLGVVQWFCRIGGKGLWDILRSKTGTGDNIVRLAGAAWGGAPAEQPPGARAQGVQPQGFALPQWQYGSRDSRPDYCAGNEMLELIDRFEHAEDWSTLAGALERFYGEHGDIEAFRHKLSYFDGESLIKLQTRFWPSWDEFVGLEAAQTALADFAAAFVSGEGAQNLTVYGEAGLGKTSLVCALAEAGELRLIAVRGGNFERLLGVLRKAAGQPMKFLVLVDGLSAPESALEDYARFEQPQNVWIVATSREELPFGTALLLEPPPLKAFILRVMELSRARGVELDYDAVQDVCIDWKVDGGDLTASAALHVLSKLVG